MVATDAEGSAAPDAVTRSCPFAAGLAKAAAAATFTTSHAARGPTVFEKLGGGDVQKGRETMKVAVDKFYNRILEDPLTAPFFKDVDMKKQRAKQTQFMTLALGGPNDYKGRDMATAHAGMNLTDDHFNAVAGHFVATLQDLGVDEATIKQAVDVVETTRSQIVGK